MTEKTSPRYNQNDDILIEKIRGMDIGKGNVLATGSPKGTTSMSFLRRYSREIKSWLGDDAENYSFEVRGIGNGYGLIVTKLRSLKSGRKTLEARAQ